MDSLQNLVYYAAVAKNTVILAEYNGENTTDFAPIAAKCLEHIPPLHSRFSYTTSNRMFICLIEGLFIYCAIMDEALSKTKAFMFLEHVRDAFKVLLEQRDVHPETLASHSLHNEMDSSFRRLASPLIGMPQKEKDRIAEEEELLVQEQRDAGSDFEVSSPSAVAPLQEMSDEDFDLQTEQKPMGGCPRSSHIPLIGKGKNREKNNVGEQEKEVKGNMMVEKDVEPVDKEKGLDILVDDNRTIGTDGHMQKLRRQAALKKWWRNVKLVIMVDVLVCLILVAVWLGVCQGVQCLTSKT